MKYSLSTRKIPRAEPDGFLEGSGYIAELQIKPKEKSNQTKNLERLYNCLVSCRCRRRHAQNSSDVTLAFEDAD